MERLYPYLPYLPIVPYVVVLNDGAIAIDYMGPSVTTITGYTAEQVTWVFWRNHIHPEDRPRIMAQLNQNPQQGVYEYEYRWLFFDESYHWLLDSGRALRNAEGEIISFVGSWSDITERKSLEIEQKRLNELFRSTLDGSPIALSAQDKQLRYQWLFNSPLVKEEEAYGRRLDELLDPELAVQIERTKEQALRTGRPQEEELELEVNGELRTYFFHTVPIFDEAGDISGVSNVRIDVTPQKRFERELRQTKQRFELTLKGSPITVFIQDKDLRYVWTYNTQLEPENNPIGRTDGEIFGEEIAQELIAYKRRAMDKCRTVVREVDVPLNGRMQTYQIRIEPLITTQGHVEGIASVAMNITSLKFIERQLSQRTQELTRSNQDLEHFAYAASHDLQEPLRAISGYLDLLKRLYQDELNPQAQEFIEEAVAGADRMRRLIQGLLDYSHINRKNHPFQTVSVAEVLAAVKRDLGPLLNENNVTITHEPLPALTADPVQISQLLQNLLTNAVKFRSERPPHIHITAEEQADKWEFRVTDNGIGLDIQYNDRIFTIFQRLHTRDEYEGLGLGLALCKRIVERHHGNIWVESQPGRGATFIFTIHKNLGETVI
ncbi:MAG: PAS domain-containing protein [Anaerolineales bacterium]|nr:PAS domain-containing protein [Anaerolineales bacterium]